MAASRVPIQNLVPPLRRGRISKAEIQERRAFLENLQIEKPTLSVAESAKLFAARFNISEAAGYQAVYNYNHSVDSQVPAVPKSLDAIATKKKSLEAQLKALQEQEQRLIEAKALKLIPCYDGKGVLIKKEGSQMALLLEDAQELVEKLTDFLTKP
jgi:hypothetical protein